MRFLSTLLFALLTTAALAHSVHRTHIVSTNDRVSIHIVREDDGEEWASFERDGVRYVTTDPNVLSEIDQAMETHRELSRDHSRLGRKHSDLGREHSRLGREHSRLGREHSRVGRQASRSGMTRDLERQQREIEAEQRKLEDQQRKLETRQRALEGEQRELESKQRLAEDEANREIEKIFQRAIRAGKAKKD